ncbi:MAG: hypothetical protein ACLVJ8_07405 [Ruthenibacterium lactatiformans]
MQTDAALLWTGWPDYFSERPASWADNAHSNGHWRADLAALPMNLEHALKNPFSHFFMMYLLFLIG